MDKDVVLTQAQEKYRTILSTTRDGFWIADMQGRFLEVNDAYCRLIGYSRDELLVMSISDVEAVERPEETAQHIQRIMKTGRDRFESRHRCKDGRIVDVEVSVNYTEVNGGQLFALLRDITEYKLIISELYILKERFQVLSENAPFGMVMIDHDGIFRYVNPKFRELFDYDLNDIPDGRTWFKKAYPDSTYRHYVISTWVKDLETFNPGERRPRIFTVTCKDGKEKIINFIPVQLKTNENLVSCEDITERRQAEETLRKSEEEANRLARENMIVAEIGRIISSTLNIDEVYALFSAKVKSLLPYDRIAINLISEDGATLMNRYVEGDSAPGRNAGEVFPMAGTLTEVMIQGRKGFIVNSQDENEIAAKYPGLLPEFRAGSRSFLSVPLISRDRPIGGLHLRSKRFQFYSKKNLGLAENIANQIAGAIANAQLFTECKRVEENLKQSEENAKQLAQENASMVEIGRVISSTLKIEDIYESFAEQVKKIVAFDRVVINSIDVENNTVKNVYIAGAEVPDRKAGEIHPLEGSVNAEMVRTRSTVLVQAEDYGDRFPRTLSTLQAGYRSIMNVPLFSDGKVIGGLLLRSRKPYAYTDHDVKLAEKIGSQIAGAIANAQLYAGFIQAEKEKTALQEQLRQSQKMEAIGRLAGGIAHDFNNLLTVIQGYSQLSIEGLEEGDPLKGNIEGIRMAGNQAADLTRQLLAFSRRQMLEMKVLDLNIVLRNLDKMLHRIIGEDIELLTLSAEGLGRVKADSGWIEQIIMNLAVNARDAMPEGGRLTIETANVELDETYARNHIGVTPGPFVMLSVSDTGIGMTPEVKDKVFEPFFTTKEKGRGTGLGLSTVYGIVKQSGGNIWVYSESGKGTTLKIYLPRVDEPLEEVRERVVKGELPPSSETILLVEDDEEVLKLTSQILEMQGYRVLQSMQGSDALRIYQQQKDNIDLILTDVVMPQMSGRQLIEQCRQKGNNFTVLYMSGYTDNAIAHHGILEKGIDYIQKPFTVEGLARKVREVLDRA